MRNFNLRHLALCFIVALCVGSCRYNDDDIIYTPLYQFNYYLTNNIDTTITFCFNQYNRSTGFLPSEHTVVLAPATSGKLYGLMGSIRFQKNREYNSRTTRDYPRRSIHNSALGSTERG